MVRRSAPAPTAASRGARSAADGIKKVPSVRETADTCVWLSNVLQRDLQRDVDADDEQALALRSADIDLSSVTIVPHRELLRSKIKQAVLYWDQLAERIPLKRQRPVGFKGQMAGSEEMFLDFDIDESTVPPEPPEKAKANEVHLYQYHVQRLMCTVPRASTLEGHTDEGSVPLRIRRVKGLLDSLRSKRVFGDTHLINERNFVNQIARPQTGSAAHAAASPGAASGDAASAMAGETTTGAGGPADGTGAAAAAAAVAIAAPPSPAVRERIVHSFTGPCRTVVTLSLYRSAAKGKVTRVPAQQAEKRMYDVEVLEHNTVQEFMETMPPCLADRIMEEKRRALRSGDGGMSEAASSSAVVSDQKCLSLGGGFLFIRGVFYVTKPAPGEDTSLVTPPPPPPSPPKPGAPRVPRPYKRCPSKGPPRRELRAAAAAKKALIREEKARARDASVAGKVSPVVRTRGGRQTSAGSPSGVSAAAPDPAGGPTPHPPLTGVEATAAAAAAAAAAPPEPWMRRWFQEGKDTWNTRKRELLERSKKEAARAAAAPGCGAAAEEDEAEENQESKESDSDENGGGGDGDGGDGAPASGSGGGVASPNPTAGAARASQPEAATAGEDLGNAGTDGGASGGGSGVDGKGKGKRKRGSAGGAAAGLDDEELQEPEDEEGLGEGEGPGASGTKRVASAGARRGGAAGASGAREGASAGARRGGAAGASGARKGASAGARRGGAVGKAPKPKRVYPPRQVPAALQGEGSSEGRLSIADIGARFGNRLGIGPDGGRVVWASDTTVGDLAPVLGERYAFLHHVECDHVFVVSDIRMEPVPVSALSNTPISAANPNAVNLDVDAATGATASMATTGGQDQRQHAGPLPTGATTGAAADAGTGAGTAASTGADVGGVAVGVTAAPGSVSSTEKGAVGAGVQGQRASTGVGEKYPRLTFRPRPNTRRCGVCFTKTGVKMSVGHPLSDKVPLVCCNDCFDLLYFDADGKPLKGELAGDVRFTTPPDEIAPAAPAGGEIGAGVRGAPKEWRVFRCYDEP